MKKESPDIKKVLAGIFVLLAVIALYLYVTIYSGVVIFDKSVTSPGDIVSFDFSVNDDLHPIKIFIMDEIDSQSGVAHVLWSYYATLHLPNGETLEKQTGGFSTEEQKKKHLGSHNRYFIFKMIPEKGPYKIEIKKEFTEGRDTVRKLGVQVRQYD